MISQQDQVYCLGDLCYTWKRNREITSKVKRRLKSGKNKVHLHFNVNAALISTKETTTNLFKQSVASSRSGTRSSPRKVTGTRRSATGKSLHTLSHFSHLDASSEGSRRAACQRHYEDTSEMAEQSARVSLSRVPLSRCFDVMGALCLVMCRSCQISGPVMALSARLLGLTEPVMELRINKRVITFPPRGHTVLSYTSKEGGGSVSRKKGQGVCHPSAIIRRTRSRASNYICSKLNSKYCIITSLLPRQTEWTPLVAPWLH